MVAGSSARRYAHKERGKPHRRPYVRPTALRPKHGRSRWSYGGPAQPSPTIAQCRNGGYGWLEVECHRCKTRASIPLDAIRRPRDTPIWKLEAALKCRLCKIRPIRAARAHDQADGDARDHALRLVASGRREVSDKLCRALAENECCEQPKTGSSDCEKETVGNEFITRPHDRTPLFDQCIRTFSDK
jgi:hypothetical protein